MRRGELYRVFRPSRDDPRRSRVLVLVGVDEGLKQPSAIHCDALVSLPKSTLTNYVGTLPPAKIPQLDRALAIALGLDL